MVLAEVTHRTAPRGQKTARVRGEERGELSGDSSPHTADRFGRRGGYSGTSWRISVSLHRWCRFLIFLCRRWVRTFQTPCGSWISRLPSRQSKCPRSLALRVHCVLLFLSRRRRNSWWKCQPFLSPTRIALRIAEQIVDTPVPRGRDCRRLQGSLPRQSSTAAGVQNVDIPVRGGLHGFLPGQSSAQRTVEQLVDSSSGGLRDFHLGQGSTASSSGREDEAFPGFFSHFSPTPKKCEGTCSLQVGTGRALELIHAGRLWRGEFARGAGAGGDEGGAPGLAHAGLHRVGGALRRQRQDLLLESSLPSDSLEDTAWRPDCLGRRRRRWNLVLAQAHPCQWLHSSSFAS